MRLRLFYYDILSFLKSNFAKCKAYLSEKALCEVPLENKLTS